TLLPTIRNLLLAKDLMERHRLSRPQAPFAFISTLNRLPAKETEHLPRKKDGTINGYALGIAAMNAHRFETNQLVRFETMRIHRGDAESEAVDGAVFFSGQMFGLFRRQTIER